MIGLEHYKEREVAVMGLARSGASAARALAAAGARVRAWDDSATRRDELNAPGVQLVDLAAADWGSTDTLVLSPGIPHTHPRAHPVAARARAAGAAIVCDIELLGQAQRQARFVGVTGTNGKSTTTALLGHILEAAGETVAVGGNIGAPALDLPALGAAATYVLELSSYQLELIHSIAFDVAVLLNISPDHLERHGGIAGYASAKRRVFADQDASQTAVIGVDDPICREFRTALESDGDARVVPISAAGPLPGGISVVDGKIEDASAVPTARHALGDLARLPGAHNAQNVAAAYAAARALGLDADEIIAGVRSFAGLAHRQELVAVIDGVRFVNDSKATNAEAAARALACYEAIYWIAGGRAKEAGLDRLAPYYPRIVHAFLIGEAAEPMAAALAGSVACTVSGDLDNAVAQARAMSREGARDDAVVLLSPACASFDQFADFEARGDAFRHAVEAGA